MPWTGAMIFSSGWVFAASCDHLRRLYDNLEYLRRPGFSRILDVPHKTGDAAITWYTEELQLLAQALADNFGVDLGLRVAGKGDPGTQQIQRHPQGNR
ncbi:MAG: 2-hydroxyacyl-CoA dehydratase family protein [Candidatus Moduliflexus flocculans]|nr:2-hydroxyacyl-CoA dehydratase family protein [Candidatus Moduliflexus flocculans]